LVFQHLITEAKKNNPFGAAVTVYSPKEYNNYRLFVTKDGSAGVAVTDDGDIISVFKDPTVETAPRGATISLLTAAVTQGGGNRLDLFDTILADIYSSLGFRAVARVPWNDKYAPEDWDYELFKMYNDGKPDIVYMVYDPNYFDVYRPGDGKLVKTHEKAVAIQKAELKKIGKTKPFTSPEAQEINRRYQDILETKYNTIKELSNPNLTVTQRQQLERSWKRINELVEEIELEAKTRGLPLGKVDRPVTKPVRNYEEGVALKNKYRQNEKADKNIWIKQSDAKNNKDRILLVQFTSDLMGIASDEHAQKYYDKLYSGVRSGYVRPGETEVSSPDFWEIPYWIAELTYNLGNKVDVYVVRDIEEAKKFLAQAGYGDIAFSALDVNKNQIKELAPAAPVSNIHVGGYLEDLGKEFEGVHPKLKTHENVK
jgi:hypothetical protein